MSEKKADGWLDVAKDGVMALQSMGTWLKYLGVGNAAGQMGAIEFLAVNIKEGCSDVAKGLHDVAEAIRERDRG